MLKTKKTTKIKTKNNKKKKKASTQISKSTTKTKKRKVTQAKKTTKTKKTAKAKSKAGSRQRSQTKKTRRTKTATKTARQKKASSSRKKQSAKVTRIKSKSNLQSQVGSQPEEGEVDGPEDKYTEALLYKDWLNQIQNQERTDLKVDDQQAVSPLPSVKRKRGSKLQLTVLVTATFLIIFSFWLASLKLDLRITTSSEKDFPSLHKMNDLWQDLSTLKKNLLNLEEDVSKLEQNRNQNSNIIYNPHNFSQEEIKVMEEKVFPKLKK